VKQRNAISGPGKRFLSLSHGTGKRRPDRRELEAARLHPVSQVHPARNDHVVTATQRRLCQWDERVEVAKSGERRQQDPHAKPLFLLDDRPPLLNIGFLQSTERLGRLLLTRVKLQPKIGEPRAYLGCRQGVHGRGI
jgi:hypothetical protein